MTAITASTDILVVGAGPVGLALAARLASEGLSVTIIDDQAAGANTSRAAVIHARTLEVLEQVGVTEALLALGVKIPLFRVRDRDKVLMTVDFSGLPTAYPFALMCPQNKTEKVLLERLEALGGNVIRPVSLVAATPSGEGVRAEMTVDGQPHTVTAKFMVGCDGMHSTVRTAADIGFEGGSYDQDFVLADVSMNWPFAKNEIDLFFSADGLVVIAPLPDDRYRIVATVDGAPENPSIAYLQELLDARGPTKTRSSISGIEWASRFHVHHRVAEANVKGPFVLCGDAAHVHSPAGGQGMNTGIQDAVSLADPLVTAIRSGDLAPLVKWAAARHEIALDVVALTDRMTRAATIKSEVGRTVRNAILSFVGAIPPANRAIAMSLAELKNR